MGDLGKQEQIRQVQFTQDLSVAPLNGTTSFDFDFKLVAIYWSFDQTLQEELTVETVLAAGGGVKIGRQRIGDVDNAAFYPDNPAESLFLKGDEIRVGVTDGAGVGNATVTVIISER